MSKTSSQVITCKAAVCWDIGEPVKLEEIQVDPPKSSEVRVKMLYASLCHSDILAAQGYPLPLFPRVIGHEGVGVVESVGEGVTEVKEGDLVIPTFVGECGECENCRSGKTNICQAYPLSFSGLMADGTSRMSVRGQMLYHLLTCSTWSEYMVVNVNYTVKVDPTIALPHASFISCGFSTGFGASLKEAKVEKGETVAVFGLGAVGLGGLPTYPHTCIHTYSRLRPPQTPNSYKEAVEGARIQGAARIIGIDKNERKREKGQAFGMTDFINPENFEKSVSETIKELTGGMGVDHCVECTGAGPLVNEALQATKMGKGTTIIVGAVNQINVEINFLSLLTGRTIKGSIFGGIKIKSDLPIIIDKCANKEIQLDELLTHELQLEDTDKAFELLKQPDCVKVLIKI